MMIEKDISNQDLMRDAKISANIITKYEMDSIWLWIK